MKKFLSILLIILIIGLGAIKLDAADIFSGANPNNSQKLTKEEVIKYSGIQDFQGISKAIEDIKNNYTSMKPGVQNNIKEITLIFANEVNMPTFLVCESTYPIAYVCKDDNFTKYVLDPAKNNSEFGKFISDHIEYSPFTLETNDMKFAYMDNKFYFTSVFSQEHKADMYVNFSYKLVYAWNGSDFNIVDYDGVSSFYNTYNGDNNTIDWNSNKTDLYDRVDEEYMLSDPYYISKIDTRNLDIGLLTTKTLLGFDSEELKKITSKDSIYEQSKFFSDVAHKEYSKIIFLLNSLPSGPSVFNNYDIAKWTVLNPYYNLVTPSGSEMLEGEYLEMWKSFTNQYITYYPPETFPIDPLNKYTQAFFGKTIDPVTIKEDGYEIIVNENDFTASFTMCMIGSSLNKIAYTVTDFSPYYDYGIIKSTCLSYGNSHNSYGLVERKKVGDENKLFLLYKSNEPFTIEQAEKALDYKLTPEFLEGFEPEVAKSKNSADEVKTYIEEILKKNAYSQDMELSTSSKNLLFKSYADFEEARSSYKLSGQVEFSKNFYDQLQSNKDELTQLKTYLQGLKLNFNPSRQNIVNIEMEANPEGQFIFSFKEPSDFENDYYHIRLKDFGMSLSLSKDDIEKLAEEGTAFAIEKIDGNLFISPLSKNRIQLPTNLKINIGKVFNGGYITDLPSLYYIDNTDHDVFVYPNHYGPIKFNSYSASNLDSTNLDRFTSVSYNNILSSNILSENSNSLNLEEPMTKAELARVCAFILGDIKDYKDIELSDVSEADQIYVKTAIKNGIFTHNGGNFNPGEPVKRSTLIYTLTECLKHKGLGVKDSYLEGIQKFTDYSKFQWMKENAQIALERGIINEDDTSLNPDSTVIRKHAIITIYRSLRALSKHAPAPESIQNPEELVTKVSARLKAPKAKEMERLKAYVFEEDESMLGKLSSLFENKIVLYMALLILILIIALIVLLIILKRKPGKKKLDSAPSPTPKKDTKKHCPNCGTEYTDEKFCTKCGQKLK